MGNYTHSKVVLTPTEFSKKVKTINTGTQGFFRCVKAPAVNRSGNPLTYIPLHNTRKQRAS